MDPISIVELVVVRRTRVDSVAVKRAVSAGSVAVADARPIVCGTGTAVGDAITVSAGGAGPVLTSAAYGIPLDK